MAKRPILQNTRFELRCSQEELVHWRAVAASHGVSLAQYIRLALGERDLKLSKSTENYPELPKITQVYPKLPKFIQNYQVLPKITYKKTGPRQTRHSSASFQPSAIILIRLPAG